MCSSTPVIWLREQGAEHCITLLVQYQWASKLHNCTQLLLALDESTDYVKIQWAQLWDGIKGHLLRTGLCAPYRWSWRCSLSVMRPCAVKWRGGWLCSPLCWPCSYWLCCSSCCRRYCHSMKYLCTPARLSELVFKWTGNIFIAYWSCKVNHYTGSERCELLSHVQFCQING